MDGDIPVGQGRALLKPMVLAKLLQAADVQGHERVLVTGCATGYSAAVLAHLAGAVIALEQDVELAWQAKAALAGYAPKVEVAVGPLTAGWPAGAPYDVILLDGAAEVDSGCPCPAAHAGRPGRRGLRAAAGDQGHNSARDRGPADRPPDLRCLSEAAARFRRSACLRFLATAGIGLRRRRLPVPILPCGGYVPRPEIMRVKPAAGVSRRLGRHHNVASWGFAGRFQRPWCGAGHARRARVTQPDAWRGAKLFIGRYGPRRGRSRSGGGLFRCDSRYARMGAGPGLSEQSVAQRAARIVARDRRKCAAGAVRVSSEAQRYRHRRPQLRKCAHSQFPVGGRSRRPYRSADDFYPRTVGATASQTLFNGFQTANRTRQAESQVDGARETLRVTEQQVLLDAATAYMNLLRDRAILDLNRRNVEVLTEQLKQTRDRFNVGEVTRTDVAQAESRLAAGRPRCSARSRTS